MAEKVLQDVLETFKLEICLSRATDSSLKALAQIARRLKFFKGEYIFNDGDASEYFYLVESGRVILSKDAPSGKAFTFLIATRGLPLNAVAQGFHPIHVGIVVVITMVIGGSTPPAGALLVVATAIANESYWKTSIEALPQKEPKT